MNKQIDRNIVLLYKGKQLIFDSENLPIEIGDKDLHEDPLTIRRLGLNPNIVIK